MTDPELDTYVEQLRNAMKGVGTDEDNLIKIASENKLNARLKIRAQYKSSYDRDLLDDFKSELTGNFLELMLGLYMDIYEYDAEQIHKSIEGLGNNEDTIIEIIGTRPGWMLKKIKEEYRGKYQAELEDDITIDISGDFQKLLLSLLTSTRSENKNPDKEKCTQIAKELSDAGEKQGAEADIIDKYLGTSSPAELMTIAREFHRVSGGSLIDAIEKVFSGSISKLIKTVFYANISPSEYFATRINDALKDTRTDDKLLNRIIITRNEIDMPLVKEYYKLLYKKDIVEDFKDDINGSYKSLIVAMINK